MSNPFAIKKAVKSQSKLRLNIYGPSASGKTMTALRIAGGLGGKVGVIDTERGSASKYADRFDFDVIELPDHTFESYTKAIKAFADGGYEVLIVDSLSHSWDAMLELKDQLAATKHRGNTWAAWADITPKQNALITTMLTFPGHFIATMRTKTEWVIEQNDKGKAAPVRIGTAPRQREGMEYEFDIVLEMNPENMGHVVKDRTGKFQERIIDKPGEDFGRELFDWLNSGEPLPEPARVTLSQEKADSLAARIEEAGISDALAFAQEIAARPLTALTDLNTAESLRVFGAIPKTPDAAEQERTEPRTPPSEAEAQAEPEREPDGTPPWEQPGAEPLPDLPDFSPEPLITAGQLTTLHTRLTGLGFNGTKADKELSRAFISYLIARAVKSSKDVTRSEAKRLLSIDDNTLALKLDEFKAERQMAAEGDE